MNDITLSAPDGIFNCRVGIIIVKDGKILLIHDEEYGIYYTVGGRIRFRESSFEAAKREAEEELGFCPEIVRPLFVHENFSATDGDRSMNWAYFISPISETERSFPEWRSGTGTYRGLYGSIWTACRKRGYIPQISAERSPELWTGG